MLVHTCICLGGLQCVRANGQKKLFIVWTGSLVWILIPASGFSVDKLRPVPTHLRKCRTASH